MLSLWDTARKGTKERLAALGEADEGFLFGGFSIADAFFWPVLTVGLAFHLVYSSGLVQANS